MIRVLLRGRTGNNLFQYATGRFLSLKYNVPLVLDGSWQRDSDWAQATCLRRLNLECSYARPFALPSKVSRKLSGKHPREFFNPSFTEDQNDHTFRPEALEIGTDAFLSGYFQSPLYFPGMRDTLRREINFRDLPMDSETEELAERISMPDTVSLHVRRGDFLHYPDTQVCHPAYYEAAMQTMVERVPNANFWIFSDDIPWCREHFKGQEVNFCDAPQSATDPFNDMRLMSLASHHIMVNSTYSWWGAWLHWNPSKYVILPDKWNTGAWVAPVVEKSEPGWITIPGNGHRKSDI